MSNSNSDISLGKHHLSWNQITFESFSQHL